MPHSPRWNFTRGRILIAAERVAAALAEKLGHRTRSGG